MFSSSKSKTKLSISHVIYVSRLVFKFQSFDKLTSDAEKALIYLAISMIA